jgi:hypothetical protein
MLPEWELSRQEAFPVFLRALLVFRGMVLAFFFFPIERLLAAAFLFLFPKMAS